MSGHSKWAQIKRQKGVNDVKRGQVFTKMAREITLAAREGGPDPEGNFRLRLAVQRARDSNLPMENIDRAIKRATGALEGPQLEQVTYEGYGPAGVAIMVQTLTDNRNRTVAEVRNVFTRAGGNLGESGCVAWNFDSMGVLTVEADGHDADDLALEAIDAGADDVKVDGGTLEVYTSTEGLESTRKALEGKKIKVSSAEFSMVAKTKVPLGEKEAHSVLKLIDKLEELDDVQEVYSNAEIPDEVMERFAAE